METRELLKKVRKIEIKTKGLSRHIFAGEYHSAFKGRGMSFSEVRAYQFGDDVRNIDWNVTARTGDPYIKIFEEERELTVMLLVDVSRSAQFGTVEQFKNRIFAEISAVLAFSAINNNDKVGVLFFSDKVEKFIPPKKGRSHILRIIRELLDIEPEGQGTDLGQALRYFSNVIKKRSICFVLSDFLTQGFEDPLRFAARRHDVIGLHVYDPVEEKLPEVGLLRAVDAETGESFWIDTASRKARLRYAEWFENHRANFKSTFLKCGGDLVSIRIPDRKEEQQADAFYIKALMQFFKKRAK